jgi:hypothetical protein
LKFAHIVLCGLAAFTLPAVALAKDPPAPAPATASTLFPGQLDIPIADGTNVPSNCEFPPSLAASDLELACIVAEPGAAADEVGVEYISWLGSNGFRHTADIIGGFAAARETDNGCEQRLNIYPHGEEDETPGIWFALDREQHCAAAPQPEMP